MRKLLKQISFTFLFLITIVSSSFSQSIEETLSNISSGAVIKYTEPVIDAFGSSMNSGWFTGLPSSSNGIHAKVRVVGIGSFFSNNLRTFTYNGDLRLTSQQVDEILNASGINPGIIPNYEEIKNEMLSRDWEVNFSGPTITGNKNDHLVVQFPGAVISGQNINGYAFELEDVRGYLDNLELLPSPALQLDVGSVMGTGVSVRYFRGINLYDLGIVDVWGAGIVHNFNYWFENPIPIDIGVGYYFQSFKVGDIFRNTASQYGIFVSKKIGSRISIQPYCGLTYETSRSEINYVYQFDSPVGTQKLNLNINYTGESSANLMIGSSINLSLFMINFDYKFGGTNTGTVGVGFGF
jgi:hypothetical protein